ncbi:MAG: membrane protein insertase YidC [Planifilum sp.]
MRKRRSRKWIGLLLLVTVIVALTGCAPDPSRFKPVDPENSFWDRFFVYPLSIALDAFNDLIGSYGLSILIVTVIIRLLLLPLTIKQMKSSKAMQALQPELKKLQEKYKNNQQKLQEETMKLFQKHNVNPMSGCLPLMIQLPVLIAFYQAIMRNEHIAQSDFLWMQLGQADPWLVLPILAALTTYLQSVATGMGNNPQTRVFLFVMPVMIFVLAYQFPAALSLYWVYSNLFSMVQYYFLGDKYRAKKQEG